MRLLNCALGDVGILFENRKIVFFGRGSWLQMVNHTVLMSLKENYQYIIDNNYGGKENIGDICLNVFPPEKIREENDCIIILTSPVYMYDMYQELVQMELSDKIECYALPFMQLVSKYEINEDVMSEAVNCGNNPKIPKVIHSFWFSGDQKPEAYQRCIDSWQEKLSGYEIIEWNMDNYDWHKHPFVERAIELKAWAFASDFARLDVLYNFGGIYLDMDVEVVKPFDDLLGNDAILSFGSNISIDLAVAGSKKDNQVIGQLLKLYDNFDLPTKKEDYAKYFQPTVIRNELADIGIKMNGSLQVLEDATVFPSCFFMPRDTILYKDFVKTDNTYCIHYDNFGWSFGTSNKNMKKKHDNSLLWNMITPN